MFTAMITARLESARETGNLSIFMGAYVIREDRGFDSWVAHIYMYDRVSCELPILFVAATVTLVDGQ